MYFLQKQTVCLLLLIQVCVMETPEEESKKEEVTNATPLGLELSSAKVLSRLKKVPGTLYAGVKNLIGKNGCPEKDSTGQEDTESNAGADENTGCEPKKTSLVKKIFSFF